MDAAPKTQNVTLYPDAPVVRYFRGWCGYQERINRPLSWLNMKVTDELKIMVLIWDRLKMNDFLVRDVLGRPYNSDEQVR